MWRVLAILVVILCFTFVNGEPKVPCFFIFGDSLSDAGSNNELTTNAKANYPPYGVDFRGGIATGRFTNGRTMVDVITELLGFEKYIIPYSTEMGQDILRGVNYASGSAGLLTESGSHLGDRIWMDRQLENYKITISKLKSMVEGPVDNYLNKCLYTINIGSNDYINNYFMPQHYPSKQRFTIAQFAELLISQYKAQLQILYNSGARKVALFGLGQIGCIPAEMKINNSTKCVKEVNNAVELFNNKLESLVDHFNANVSGAKFTFINLYDMQKLTRILPIGFITDSVCCKLRSDYQCEPFAKPCRYRDLHGFMDGFHPSEVMNELAATNSYHAPLPLFVHPMSIHRLVRS